MDKLYKVLLFIYIVRKIAYLQIDIKPETIYVLSHKLFLSLIMFSVNYYFNKTSSSGSMGERSNREMKTWDDTEF